MPIDTALVGALHVEYLKKRDLGEEEARHHHALFQTSTIDALLRGEYDGDVDFAELGGRGDFGLGTLEALDGEMVALDGSFYQVKADGRAYEIDPRARTPFAVVTFFEPTLSRTLDTPTDFDGFCALLDEDRSHTHTSLRLRAEEPSVTPTLTGPRKLGFEPINEPGRVDILGLVLSSSPAD